MRSQLFWLSVAVTTAAVVLHLLGFLWHRPPEPIYYAILLINYAPKWVWLIPSVLAFALTLQRKRLVTALTALLLLTVIWMQDIQLRSVLIPAGDSVESLTILTLNTGGVSQATLAQLVQRHSPDILVLQEFQQKNIENMLEEPWHSHCAAHICVASRFPFTLIEAFNRTTFSDWGSFAAAYNMDINGKQLRVINAHLETPRDALGGRPLVDFNARETAEYSYEKHTELKILAALLDVAHPAIIAGDLNISVFEAAYREHLGSYTNAVDVAARGINYTKYTSWHGVRIDHVVANEKITINNASVLSETGGDHRPVLVELSLDE